MKAIIFGATGMVGSEVLQYCLNHSGITEVVTVGRNSSGLTHSKLLEIPHSNFLDFSELEKLFKSADICFYCIGVYQGQVSKEVFWEITVEYFGALIRTLEVANPNSSVCLFSARGADPKEKSIAMFANAKGHAEAMFGASKIKHQYIFRPGFIAPGKIATQNTSSIQIFKPIYKLLPFIGIDAPDLAKVMVNIGLAMGANHVFENRQIRALS
jgi:uncharacterized protein YbjT (DUF2867 family)